MSHDLQPEESIVRSFGNAVQQCITPVSRHTSPNMKGRSPLFLCASLKYLRFPITSHLDEKFCAMFAKVALVLTAALSLVDAQFNNPTGVDIWCGKAYRDT